MVNKPLIRPYFLVGVALGGVAMFMAIWKGSLTTPGIGDGHFFSIVAD